MTALSAFLLPRIRRRQPQLPKSLVLLFAKPTLFVRGVGRNLVRVFEGRGVLLHGEGLPDPAHHDNHP